jgi:hypothetical protein
MDDGNKNIAEDMKMDTVLKSIKFLVIRMLALCREWPSPTPRQ